MRVLRTLVNSMSDIVTYILNAFRVASFISALTIKMESATKQLNELKKKNQNEQSGIAMAISSKKGNVNNIKSAVEKLEKKLVCTSIRIYIVRMTHVPV